MDWDYWSRIADTVGGFSTLLGLIFAAEAYSAWRTQKSAELRSQAAAKLLTAVLKACAGLRALASPMYGLELAPKRPAPAQFATEYKRREDALAPVWQELDAAAEAAAVYLDREDVFLSLVVQRRAIMRYAFEDYVEALATADDAKIAAAESRFRDESAKEVANIEMLARNGLKPIIRFEQRFRWWRLLGLPVVLPYRWWTQRKMSRPASDR